jgi:hypothetical protein
MKIYPNLFAYLNQEDTVQANRVLHGCDRPVIVLDLEENLLSKSDKSVIPIMERVYELAVPHVQISDWGSYGELKKPIFLSTEYERVELAITDRVLDSELVPEEKQKELKQSLGSGFDHNTGDIIKIFVGIFSLLLGDKRKGDVPLLSIYEKLETLSKQEARLPLVVSLERKHQLKRKLELIAPKLRSQLRRQAELMPIGKLQEMDAYCLRDYIRRPGEDAIEKAGARQMLMGIQRYQDFNTPENRFLVGFSDLLHLECSTYKQHEDAKKLGLAIDRFRQEPDVQTIQKQRNLLDKPNYVLQQNPIYRSFYEACLEFIKKRTDKDEIWGDRHHLASDVVGILIISAIMQFQGAFLSPNAKIEIRSVANYGEYITTECVEQITCFTQTHVYKLSLSNLSKNSDKSLGIVCDWILDINIQDLSSLELSSHSIPLWIFWYSPSSSCLASAQLYLDRLNIPCGVLIYVQNSPDVYPLTESNLILFCLPNLMDKNNNGLISCVDSMADLLSKIVNQLHQE